MRERPILFSAPMVRAILSGTKTQTRRVAIQTAGGHLKEPSGHRRWHPADPEAALACRYGQPGDRLWVRETFAEGIHQMAGVNHWAYSADRFGEQQRLGDRWKPSIHMPRAASRILLEIISVRVERLQAISEADAMAEGCLGKLAEAAPAADEAREQFRDLWQSINGADSWAANPWVWVVEFKRVGGE